MLVTHAVLEAGSRGMCRDALFGVVFVAVRDGSPSACLEFRRAPFCEMLLLGHNLPQFEALPTRLKRRYFKYVCNAHGDAGCVVGVSMVHGLWCWVIAAGCRHPAQAPSGDDDDDEVGLGIRIHIPVHMCGWQK